VARTFSRGLKKDYRVRKAIYSEVCCRASFSVFVFRIFFSYSCDTTWKLDHHTEVMNARTLWSTRYRVFSTGGFSKLLINYVLNHSPLSASSQEKARCQFHPLPLHRRCPRPSVNEVTMPHLGNKASPELQWPPTRFSAHSNPTPPHSASE
jgi:hypothetical protein